MPIKLCHCLNCHNEYEYLTVRSDDKPICPKCHSKMYEEKIGKTNFELKGVGWAKDNYSKVAK